MPCDDVASPYICLILLPYASCLTFWYYLFTFKILSYSCEVWAVNPKVGAKAELVHRQFLKQLLGVRKSTTTHIVLAEFGRFPLQIHFWQQIFLPQQSSGSTKQPA